MAGSPVVENELAAIRRHSLAPRASVSVDTGPWGRKQSIGAGRPIPKHIVVKESGVDFAIGETLVGKIAITPHVTATLARLRQAVDKGNQVRLITPADDYDWAKISSGLTIACLDLLGLCTPRMQECHQWISLELCAKNILQYLKKMHDFEPERLNLKPDPLSTSFDGSVALQYMLQTVLVFTNDGLRHWLDKGDMNETHMDHALSVMKQFEVIFESYIKIWELGDKTEAPFYLHTPDEIPDISVHNIHSLVDPSDVYISGWWNNKKLQSFYVEIMLVSLSAIGSTKYRNKYTRVGSFLLNGALNLPKKQAGQAKRMTAATKDMSVDKARAIWDLQSQPLINCYIEFMNPNVAISRLFVIPFEDLQLNNEKTQLPSGALKLAPVPKLPDAFLDSKPSITVRIIYPYNNLDLSKLPPKPKKTVDDLIPSLIGQMKKTAPAKVYFKSPPPPSGHPEKPEGLIIHYHGGGFIALDSFGHEIYLRAWAKETGLPVLSVDYHWAPEHRFPVQLHECYETYVWARKNGDKLGLAPNAKIVLVGDSAGGNMVAAVTIRAINEGFQVPDGCLIEYPVSNNNARPSPSRLISLLDPLVSFPFMKVCQDSYTEEGTDRVNDWHISPAAAPQEILKRFPPTHIHVGAYDPLLDDSIVLAERLQRAGNKCTLNVYDALGHGYLNLYHDVPEAKLPLHDAAKVLKELAS